MDRTFAVVILGGGVIGNSIAYVPTAEPGFSGSIAVIERDPNHGASSAPLSMSATRQQFGNTWPDR